MSGFRQALAYLLPQGFAWPRDPDSVWMRLLGGVADAFDELDAFTNQAVAEWLPHSTHTRLAEWEEATNLPDACFGPTQTYVDRQARVLARLRGPSGEYADSSPAALSAYEAFCRNLGFEATAHYNTRFRCGRDRVGRRLGTNDGVLHVLVTVDQTPFRVGTNRVGDRLVKRPPGVDEMACALEHIVPARYELNVVFVSA